MKYYFSGIDTFNDDDRRKYAAVCRYRLLSCHEGYIKHAHKWIESLLANNDCTNNTILLDSGAFTAWTKGNEVDLRILMRTYYDFMTKYWGKVREIYLINLDKIPGSPGRTADAAEIEHCLKVSDINYAQLVREFGDRVLPVFHQNESEQRLHDVAQMAQYICVSPRNDLHENLRVKWSIEVHSKLPPTSRTHGLAATGIDMMTRVPWTSVDSASWIFGAAMGNVTLSINGTLVNVCVSDSSPNRQVRGQHITTLPEIHQQAILARLNQIGVTLDELATQHSRRMGVTLDETIYWLNNHHQLQFEPFEGLFPL